MFINPQFIGSRQTHRKRVLHRIDLQEHRGELYIENQRERRSHLANNYGPEGCGKLLTLYRRGYGVDVEALRDRFPLRQIAGKGPKMGSHGYRKLWRWKSGFVAPWMLAVAKEVGRWSYEGPTRVAARLPPWARPPAL